MTRTSGIFTNVATFIPISHVNKSPVSSIHKLRVSVIIAIIFLSISCYNSIFLFVCLYLLLTRLETWNAPLPVCQRLFSRTELHDAGCSLQLWWTFCDYFDGSILSYKFCSSRNGCRLHQPSIVLQNFLYFLFNNCKKANLTNVAFLPDFFLPCFVLHLSG